MADQKILNSNQGEKDKKFLVENPVQGGIVQIGAAMTGVADAAKVSLGEHKELAQKLIEPGDMNIENSPHPIDAVNKVAQRLAVQGDMNIKHSPHPVDMATAVANKKIDEIKAAGPIAGAKIGAEAIAIAAIDELGPGGKAKAVKKLLEVADEVADVSKLENKIRHVEGELVNAVTTGTNEVSVIGDKALSIADKPTTMLARAKEKAKEVVSKVPVLGDVVNPSLETRIALQAHKNRPDSDTILRAAHQGKTGELNQAQQAMRESADDLIKKAKDNPDAAAQANKVLTNEQIQAGIVKNLDPSALKLTHGAAGKGVNLPDVTPPSYKDFLPMSVRDAAHLALMPQNASPVRMARVSELMNAEYPIHATRVQMAGVPYAWAAIGGGSIAAVKYALSGKDEKISNSELADTFTNAIHANNQDKQKLIQGIGGSDEQKSAFKNAVRIYEQAEQNVFINKTLTASEKNENLQKIEKHFHDVISEGKLDQLNVQGKSTDMTHEQLTRTSSGREAQLVEVPSNVQSTIEP